MATIMTETEKRDNKTTQERLMAYVKGMEKLKNKGGQKGDKSA